MFNRAIAEKTHGVSDEQSLREKLYGTRSDLTEVERQSIISCLEKFDAPRYCEVGVYFGGTFLSVMEWLVEHRKEWFAYGVDLFEDIVDHDNTDQTHDLYNKWNILNVAYSHELETHFLNRGMKTFSLLKGDSSEKILEVQEPCDVYFLDGNHTYAQTMKDALASIKHCKDGSYIVFHNASTSIPPDDQYLKRDGGPYKVVEALSYRDDIDFVGLYDRCAVLQVKK